MPIRAIVYASQLAPQTSQAHFSRLLADAARFNRLAGVTGVLLFDGRRFLQYIEGPEDGIDSVYPRITSASSHIGQLELARGPVCSRLFPNWAMHDLAVDALELDRVIAADWAALLRSDPSGAEPGEGLRRLLELARRAGVTLLP